jgi:hypothetical protein
MSKTFEPNKDDVAGGWWKLHDKIHIVYSSPDITWITKSISRRDGRKVNNFNYEKLEDPISDGRQTPGLYFSKVATASFQQIN